MPSFLLPGILAIGAAVALAGHPPVQRIGATTAGWPLGDFTLNDRRGGTLTQDRLLGRWTLLLLADSRCHEACASAVAALEGLFRRIANTEVVRTTQAICIFPDGADIPVWSDGRQAPPAPRVVLATGPPEILAGLADDLGVPPAADAAEGASAGAAPAQPSIWLIGPDKVVRAEFRPPFDVRRLTAAYLRTRLRG